MFHGHVLVGGQGSEGLQSRLSSGESREKAKDPALMPSPMLLTGWGAGFPSPVPPSLPSKDVEGRAVSAVFVLHTLTSLKIQLVKNLPAIQETPVRFLGQEDPLEKG